MSANLTGLEEHTNLLLHGFTMNPLVQAPVACTINKYDHHRLQLYYKGSQGA
jgi:hypothetical protein